MDHETSTASQTLDDRMKTLGLVLGLVSTLIGIFVAIKTQIISAKTDAIGEQTQRAAERLDILQKEQQYRVALLDERSKTFETSTRLYVDWRVMNAHEFASALDGEPEFTWIDGELETQLRSASKAWKDGRRLMARGTNDALLLRQVICLRVVNGSKSPAKNIRLRAHVGDFDPRVGGGGELYGELPERHSFTISEIKVGELMERAQKENDLPTELLIPLAQAVGDQRYVGRVLVPMGLDWYDEPHQKAGRITIDPQTPQLRNRLNSARLGLSKDAD